VNGPLAGADAEAPTSLFAGTQRRKGVSFNRDAFFMVPRSVAIDECLEALFPIQDDRPEVVVMGIAVLFATVCSRVGIDPSEAHAAGLKVLTDQDYNSDNDRLQALRDYAGLCIKGDEVTVL
jgi:hypothetical protein